MRCHFDPNRVASLAACRDQLHVQGYMLAVDRVGLHTLLRHWRVPTGKGDSIMHNEVGATAQFLTAGYNVAVMQRFWRGHDFRDFEVG